MSQNQKNSSFEQFNAFHTVWNAQKIAKPSFLQGVNYYKEIGYGKLNLIINEGDAPDLMHVSMIREGDGQPAVYAEYFAAQIYMAQERGETPADIKKILENARNHLEHDEETRNSVLRRSLGATAADLDGIIQLANLEAESLGGDNDSDSAREALEAHLRNYISNRRGEKK